jgi:hypothetical protein
VILSRRSGIVEWGLPPMRKNCWLGCEGPGGVEPRSGDFSPGNRTFSYFLTGVNRNLQAPATTDEFGTGFDPHSKNAIPHRLQVFSLGGLSVHESLKIVLTDSEKDWPSVSLTRSPAEGGAMNFPEGRG